MVWEILRRTPPWVFVLFLALLALGLAQSRPRRVSRQWVAALPAAMALMSVYGAVSAFGLTIATLGAWLAGWYFAFWRDPGPQQRRAISFDPATQRFAVPGSWIPLALMMAIFFLRYVVNVMLARQLPLAASPAFGALVGLAYGLFSGAFAARAWAIWSAQPGARAMLPRLPVSRRRVVIVALCALALLDLGRSLNAHYGYSQPAELWRAGPEFAEIAWPPGADTPATASLGQKLYLRNCAVCHGPEGKGNGPAAPSMIPRPRDFTRGEFKYKTTHAGFAPTDGDLRSVIADGLRASGMPYFRDVLNETEIEAVVAHVKTLAPADAKAAQAIAMPPRPAVTAAAIARGQQTYRQQSCASCHGEDLRGGMKLKDAKGQPVVSRDLTAPWTFRGGSSPEQVFLRLTAGMAPSPMPAYATLPAASRWDLVAFIESQKRVAPWEPGGKLAGPAQSADLLARGRHLVHSQMCGLCHTQVSERDVYREDRYLAGGMLVGAHPQGVFVSRNLTPDVETGLGRWSEEEIASAIRRGRGKDGRLLNFWGMPWMYLHDLSEDDARAIARYLKTLPAVRNEVPELVHYGFLETVVSKIRNGHVLLGRAPRLTYAIGSYGNLSGWRPDHAQTALIWAQWIAIALALLAMPLTAGIERRVRTSWAARARAAGLVLVAGVVCVAAYVLHGTPTLGFVPPEKVATGAAGSIPQPKLDGLPPERAALLTRGRTIFAAGSCAYCHGNDGAGGFKLSGGNNGTIYIPNISSHSSAGIGNWSDAQIARAIRTGVSRSGRPLWWQGMPWDHFSNLDEEDVVAVVAYLRTLPPMERVVPDYRPPSADDCRVYTFWTVPNSEPGCK